MHNEKMVASKRSHSDFSDSEFNDDHFDEGSSFEQSSDSDQHGGDRKRRRGMIEKKRRDRINNSLNEMKSLIPTACERQASTKLEKSEILQMAVEHIKVLQSRETANPHAMAMDYRSIGYRECIGEVMSYLTSVEGFANQDPLHSRLISHLHKQASYIEQSSSTSLYEQHNFATTQYFKQELSSTTDSGFCNMRNGSLECSNSPSNKYNNFPSQQLNSVDTSYQPNPLAFSFPWHQQQTHSTSPLSYQPQCSWV